tara:strand:- start:80 stop:373 length:294 start_codon:yes stop_codon:yes gene_type:complete
MIDKLKAIQSLRPDAEFVITGEVVEWVDKKQTQPTEKEIQAEIVRLQAEYDAKAYQRKRQPEYPNIGDQLDDLYKAGAFSDDMTAKIKAVKDKYPKE